VSTPDGTDRCFCKLLFPLFFKHLQFVKNDNFKMFFLNKGVCGTKYKEECLWYIPARFIKFRREMHSFRIICCTIKKI
jgi:hypothetical protein